MLRRNYAALARPVLFQSIRSSPAEDERCRPPDIEVEFAHINYWEDHSEEAKT